MKRIAFILAIVALGMTSCNKLDIQNPSEESSLETRMHHLSIPASMDDDATKAVTFDGTTSNSTFSASEKVYVYNKTTNAILTGYLQPANISGDGKKCDLQGELTGSISENDVLLLLYNAASKPDETYFYYGGQKGTQESVCDGAQAEVTVSSYAGSVLTTSTTAQFSYVQSMFRFQFAYGSNPINVETLLIESKNNALASEYHPLNTVIPYEYHSYSCMLETATTKPIYVAICFDESKSADDVLSFTVTDNKGKRYKGSRAAPTGGFKNGRYYYNTSAIALQPAYFAATKEDIGKVIGSDGGIYDTPEDMWNARIDNIAIGMIAYVGSIDGVCEHGLAISLTDAYAYNATYAEATGDVIIPSWATYHKVAGGTWRLPSEKDWQYLMWAYYAENPVAQNIEDFNTKLGTVGTALVATENYWTSTSIDDDKAKVIYFDGTFAGVVESQKDWYWHVRACLAF